MGRFMLGVLLCAAVAAVAAPSVMAHEGHAHKVMGTVASVGGPHLEVKDKDGKMTMHMLDAKTKIRRGKAVAAISDIRVGDRIVVTYVESKDKAGKAVVTVTQVDLSESTTPAARS